MAITHLKELVADTLHQWCLVRRVEADADRHNELIERIAKAFAVSNDAAKTRLHKLGYVVSTA